MDFWLDTTKYHVELTARQEHFKGLYRDQAPHRGWIEPGRSFFAAKTYWAVQRIDSEFLERVWSLGSRDDAITLRKEIHQNPHLHGKIKQNLYLNIRGILKVNGWQALPRLDAR